MVNLMPIMVFTDPLNRLLLERHQGPTVGISGTQIQPPAFPFARTIIHLRFMDQGFAWDAAPVDTGPTELRRFDHQHLLAGGRGNPGTSKSSRPRAKNDD